MNERKILIIDDDMSYLSLCVDYFHEQGYKVCTAINAQIGWELFQANSDTFSAILTDHNMPEMKGAEFVSLLRENKFNIPIVMMSGDLRSVDYDFNSDKMTIALSKPLRLSALDEIFSKLTHMPLPE